MAAPFVTILALACGAVVRGDDESVLLQRENQNSDHPVDSDLVVETQREAERQLRLEHSKRSSTKNRWDLQGVLRDDPPGSYFELLKPLTYAAYLTYPESNDGEMSNPDQPWMDIWSTFWHADNKELGDLSGSGHWERMYDVEQDPSEGGPHMRAIVDHERMRVILAFRGACFDALQPACRNDMCAAMIARVEALPDTCQAVGKSAKEYIAMAASDVMRVRKTLGDEYAIMVTGHSLGGLLSLTLGAMYPGDFQVVALEPTPFGAYMKKALGLHHKDLMNLDPANRVAIYDPYDFASTNFGPMETFRPRTTVCIYEESVHLPVECKDCVRHLRKFQPWLNKEKALMQCMNSVMEGYTTCKDRVHFLSRYADTYLVLKHPNNTAVLPRCQVVDV